VIFRASKTSRAGLSVASGEVRQFVSTRVALLYVRWCVAAQKRFDYDQQQCDSLSASPLLMRWTRAQHTGTP
ncbi:MAG TPA: hypothetical protein VKR83_05060, partial [Ktedonobacteraceae bacterium]|nr:hypothetical protein [Ktedonobacteraceae bacterium]